MEDIRDCDYCEGLGFRTISVEQDNGTGSIEQEECEKCKGTGLAKPVADGNRPH